MEEQDGLCTVEQWYCISREKNVPVAISATDGTRRCVSGEACCLSGRCDNRYVQQRGAPPSLTN